MKRLLVVLLFLANATVATAQHASGSLDSSFGVNGVAIDSFTDGNMMWADQVVVQPDGKILTAGSSVNRYLPDGQPDLSFAGTGQVRIGGRCLHVLGDGRILATSSDSLGPFVRRLLPNGTTDSSYGTNGTAYLQVGAYASQLQNDGKLLVGHSDVAVRLQRLLSDGRIDSSFGVNGLAVAPSGGYSAITLSNPDTLADGRIVVAGIGYDQWTRSAMLMRFLRNGRPDSSFGTYGKIYLFPMDYCRDMKLQKDGKILAAFGNLDETDIMRFAADGTVDASFGANGVFTVPYRVAQFKRTDSGVIYCVGDDGDFMLSKIKAEGRGLDSSFGGNGTVRTSITPNDRERAYTLCIQPDGKIITAGQSILDLYYATSRLTMVRYYDTVVRPTGVAPTQLQPLALHPNPAGSSIQLTGIQNSQFGRSYAIISSTGQVMQRGTLPPAASYTLPISMLPAGLYYLRLPAATLPFLKH